MFVLLLSQFTELVSKPPNTLWFIFLVSFMVSFVSTILNKFLIDHDRLNRQQEVIKEHQELKKELLKMSEENPKRYAREYVKWQRKDKAVQKMQQRMSLDRLKPTCITFIPLIIFFYVIRSIYTSDAGITLPVAIPAMNPMQELPYFFARMMESELYSVLGNYQKDYGFMGFTGYYILCSVTWSMIMQKLFGIQRTAQAGPGGAGMGGMFDTSSQMELPKPRF